MSDAQLERDARRWAHTVVNDVFDIAVEREFAAPIWTSILAMGLVALSGSWQRLDPSTLPEWIVIAFFGIVTLVGLIGLTVVSSVVRSGPLREELGKRLTAQAVARVQRRRAFQVPAPEPTSGIDWRTFERLAIQWMHHMGDVDMRLTRSGPDGGIDGISAGFVMQAKRYDRDLVGVEQVRALHGVAASQNRRGVFFTTCGYTSAAREFARTAGISLFVADVERARLLPASAAAEQLRNDGVYVMVKAARAAT